MGEIIIKIKDKYFLYSTCADGLTTYGHTKNQIKEIVLQRSIQKAVDNYVACIDQRMHRVEETGSSALGGGDCVEDFLCCNRAGDNEEFLTVDEIYEKFSEVENNER